MKKVIILGLVFASHLPAKADVDRAEIGRVADLVQADLSIEPALGVGSGKEETLIAEVRRRLESNPATRVTNLWIDAAYKSDDGSRLVVADVKGNHGEYTVSAVAKLLLMEKEAVVAVEFVD